MRERKSPTATEIGTPARTDECTGKRRKRKHARHNLQKGLSLLQVHAARADENTTHKESVAMLTPGWSERMATQ